MDMLISDRAKVEISNKVLAILRGYLIQDCQSEPYHQHQNPSERRYSTMKRFVQLIMDRVGAPAFLWFLCLQYVAYLLNRLATKSLDYKTPYQALNGQLPDISALCHYWFYHPIFYLTHSKHFSSESREKCGW